MIRALNFLAAGICALSTVCAQEEAPKFGQVKTKAASALRVRPDPSSSVLSRVPAGATLRWVEGQKVNSFVRVIGPNGPQGWLSEADITVVSQPLAPDRQTEAAAAPCKTTLAGCPVTGCAVSASTAQAVFNKTKRRIPAPGAPETAIDFDDLRSLQQKAESLVGAGGDLSAAQRAKLKAMPVKAGKVAEGSVARLSGFIASKTLAPRANSGESVNCRLKGDSNNDFHINITPGPNMSEFEGVVTEMIPQQRNPGWTLAKLVDLQHKQLPVLVRGALFYDNAHIVNDDPAQPLNGQPRRMSLWELHPITSLLVCKAGPGKCTPDSPTGWVALEDMP